jgi:hypothetical protein
MALSREPGGNFAPSAHPRFARNLAEALLELEFAVFRN